MSEAERLLDYLWNTADVEAAIAVHDGGRVRELFRPDDPLALEIDEALAAPSLLQERDRLATERLNTVERIRDHFRNDSDSAVTTTKVIRRILDEVSS